jgi:Mrp family chromosome partitioning ATPase
MYRNLSAAPHAGAAFALAAVLGTMALAAGAAGAGDAALGEVLYQGCEDEAEAADAIHPITALKDSPRTGVISFMASGRKSPRFLPAVDWSKARTSFKSISQAFSMVFLDSPPILAANDALLFARIVDAVVLVVGTGNANLDGIRRAKEHLDAVDTPIIGAVLNRFEPKDHGPSNQPYRSYYRDLRM